MSDENKTRRTEVEVTFDGVDITNSIKPYLLSITYMDNEEGETDDLGDEMADVLWVLLCLANQTGVDLTEALEESFRKKTLRDKDRHKNNLKLQ